jgi:hypothetical protein
VAWVLFFSFFYFFVLCVKLLLPFFTFAKGRGCSFFHVLVIILYIFNKCFGIFFTFLRAGGGMSFLKTC